MSWTELPVELILLIASLVDKRKDLGALRLLSKRCNLIVQEVLWKNPLMINIVDLPNLLRFIDSASSSLPHFVTALLIEPEPFPYDETQGSPILHRVLESLPGLQVLYITSLKRLYRDLSAPCPVGLRNIRHLHLMGTMKISPSDVYWCMTKMLSLLELEAWVQIDASALPVHPGATNDLTSPVTHLKLQFWIQAFFHASQSILLQLVNIPKRLQSLILYDISFYRYVPLAPLVRAVASSAPTLKHFELRQHVDSRVQINDQFGTASFAHFTTLENLVLPCLYLLNPIRTHHQSPFPEQLHVLRLCPPALLSWDVLSELILYKPSGLQRLLVDVSGTSGLLLRRLSRDFPHVVAEPQSGGNHIVSDGASVTLTFPIVNPNLEET